MPLLGSRLSAYAMGLAGLHVTERMGTLTKHILKNLILEPS